MHDFYDILGLFVKFLCKFFDQFFGSFLKMGEHEFSDIICFWSRYDIFVRVVSSFFVGFGRVLDLFGALFGGTFGRFPHVLGLIAFPESTDF